MRLGVNCELLPCAEHSFAMCYENVCSQWRLYRRFLERRCLRVCRQLCLALCHHRRLRRPQHGQLPHLKDQQPQVCPYYYICFTSECTIYHCFCWALWQVDYFRDIGNKDWSTFLRSQVLIGSESDYLLEKLRRIFEIWDSLAGLKVEKLGGVVNSAGEWGDVVVERAPRDRLRLQFAYFVS